MNEVDDSTLRSWCKNAVERHRQAFPEDQPRLLEITQLLGGSTPLADRRSLPGHVTASAILFDRTAQKLLLIHHRGLDRWLQPGGHVDPGELPAAAARRECLEEVGFDPGEPVSLAVIDIDSHAIPANPRKGEPGHTHHDFRFVFEVRASDEPLTLADGEVADAVWMGVDDPRFPEDLRRVLGRILG